MCPLPGEARCCFFDGKGRAPAKPRWEGPHPETEPKPLLLLKIVLLPRLPYFLSLFFRHPSFFPSP